MKQWNNKNKEYCKNNYLGRKIEIVEEQEEEAAREDTDHKEVTSRIKLNSGNPTQLVLPYEIIKNEYGIKNFECRSEVSK